MAGSMTAASPVWRGGVGYEGQAHRSSGVCLEDMGLSSPSRFTAVCPKPRLRGVSGVFTMIRRAECDARVGGRVSSNGVTMAGAIGECHTLQRGATDLQVLQTAALALLPLVTQCE